jgi:hypothetical protein
MKCTSLLFNGKSIARPYSQDCARGIPEGKKCHGWSAATSNDPDDSGSKQSQVRPNAWVVYEQHHA